MARDTSADNLDPQDHVPYLGIVYPGNSVMDGYRPWLDSIRALSIILVLLQHMPVGQMTLLNFGGTGVGVFFVLSGYLITGLLLKEASETHRIALKKFYIRRAARLLPALALVVLIVDPIFWSLGRYEEILASLYALGYVSNYAIILLRQYTPAFGHTWSLSVEEHFYLAWPLVLIWLLRKQDLSYALRQTLIVCAAVLAWRLLLTLVGAPSRLLYIGSLERADTLLYGCAAAIATHMGWRPPRYFAWLGFVMVAVFLVVSRQPGTQPWAWLIALLLNIGAAMILPTLDHADVPGARKLLSFAPLVWLGSISYGLYLWHVPVYHLLEIAHLRGTIGQEMAGTALAIFVAWLSYRYFETPIRDHVRRRTREEGVAGRPPADDTMRLTRVLPPEGDAR